MTTIFFIKHNLVGVYYTYVNTMFNFHFCWRLFSVIWRRDAFFVCSCFQLHTVSHVITIFHNYLHTWVSIFIHILYRMIWITPKKSLFQKLPTCVFTFLEIVFLEKRNEFVQFHYPALYRSRERQLGMYVCKTIWVNKHFSSGNSSLIPITYVGI